jgi:transposase-like protein
MAALPIRHHRPAVRWVRFLCSGTQQTLPSSPKTDNDSWRVDETYIEVKGEWKYLYRAVDSEGNTTLVYVECLPGCAGGRTIFFED